MRVEPLDRRAQVRSEALVVGDDLAVGAELADARRVEAADDRYPLAARRHEERALPRAVRAGNEIEARVLREQRLAREREPEADVLLAEDPCGLVELLVDEHLGRGQDRDTSRRPAPATPRRRSPGAAFGHDGAVPSSGR